jgi:ATP-binding cassette subfamily G (WHITE) protein 2 (SNQ2)
MAGVFIPPTSMPHFWHVSKLSPKYNFSRTHFWQVWAYPINPFRYFTEGIISTAVDPIIIKCSNKDFFRFLPPPGQTCGNYTTEFLTYATGYINNPLATSPDLCEYCEFKTGREYLASVLDWHVDNRWRDFGLLVGYWMFNVCLGVVFVYLFRKQRR